MATTAGAMSMKSGAYRRSWSGGLTLLVMALVGASAIVAVGGQAAGAEGDWQVVAPAGESIGVDQFSPGWFAAGAVHETVPVSYRKASDGSVRVRGVALTTGSDTFVLGSLPASPVFRLACGFRPRLTSFASVSVLRTSEAMVPEGLGSGLVIVQPDGTVSVASTELTTDGTLRGGAVMDFVLDADKVEFPGDCDHREGTTIYVAPENPPADPAGDPESIGTDENAPTSFRAALARAVPGDHILLRGGQYDVSDTWRFDGLAGTEEDPIVIANYPGEIPVFDGTHMPVYDHDSPTGYRPMLLFHDASWLEVTGLEIQHSTFKGIDCTNCDDTRWANLNVHNNAEAGFVLYDAEDSDDSSSRNTFVDSDFHHNHDKWYQGEESDGLNIWNVRGQGNKVIRCRFFDNADDGLEMLDTEAPVLITDSWSFRNGINQWYAIDGYQPEEFGGDGGGFGLGGAGTGSPDPFPGETKKPAPSTDHVIVRSLAWENTQGFKTNGSGGKIQAYHDIAYDNRELDYHFFKLGWPDDPDFTVDVRDSIAIDDVAPSLGVFAIDNPGVNMSEGTNSWDTPGISADASDVDLDPAQKAIAEGPRPFFGPNNMPVTTWLHLVEGSDLIDSASPIASDPEDPDYPPYPSDPDPPTNDDHISWVFFNDFGPYPAEAE